MVVTGPASNDQTQALNVSDLIDNRPMSRFQIRTILLGGLVLFADGFDAQTIGFLATPIAESRGIPVNSFGPIFSASLIGLMIAADRQIVFATRDLCNGEWKKKVYQSARGLKGRTLGIVGLGAIGKSVVAKVQGFRVNVIAYDPVWDDEFAAKHKVGRAEFADLLSQADIVSLHAPATDGTAGLINADALSHVMTGHGAITAVMIGFEFFHAAGHRSNNFHGSVKELFFDGVGAVVAGASFDCFHPGFRHQLEDIAGFHAEILHALVTCRMIGHLSQ